MRLSVVFELLLIFILLAFAASRVIEPQRAIERKNQKQNTPNRYCTCTNVMCNCCRDFTLPVVPIKGPGCATLMYLQGDSMMITMKFGNRVLHNTTISGKKPKPVCMPLPGGISKFCGRVYGISREGEHFKACLGLELRALDDLEAALRVSCFKFGPQGLNLEPAPPVPTDPVDDEKDDDDDDDDYGIADDDDDDDDDDDFGLDDDDDDDDDDDASENDVSPDYGGFSVFGDGFLNELFGDTNKKKKTPPESKPKPAFKPLRSTTEKPVSAVPQPTKPATKPSGKPASVTRPIRTTQRPIRRPSTTRKPPPSRYTRPTRPTTTTTTTTTTTAAPETKLPEVVIMSEPVTSTAITYTVIESDENETVSPDILNDENMDSSDGEKISQTDDHIVEMTESSEDIIDMASTEVNSEEDVKQDEPQGANEEEEEDEEDDDDEREDEDDDDEGDEDEDDDDEDSTNETETATPNENVETIVNQKIEKKKDDDEDDDDILDFGLDEEDDDEEEDKDRGIPNPVVRLRSGRTHRRMRI